jgi:O-antigen/teichoic acid export membrane protein
MTGSPRAELPVDEPGEAMTVTRNLSTRYLAIAVETVLGFLILPFNVSHLGQSAYGLWILTTSITAYFSVLDLGYGGALVKFVAQYRAKRDWRGLNEILSTTFYLFAGCGVLTYLVAIGIALYLDRVLQLEADQVRTGQIILLITALNVSLGTVFSVFGAVINGFQRYDINNVTGTLCSVAVAVTNLVVLMAGFGLIALVAATTTVRVLAYFIYRGNAYRVFPDLHLRPAYVRRSRFREVTSFSLYVFAIDWARKLNYSIDAIVIGIFMNTSAVAIWSIGQRLAEATQRFTNQLTDVLFPVVVDHDTSSRLNRLQAVFTVGTRFSMAMVVPIATGLVIMAEPLVFAWVGPAFTESVLILQLLTLTVAIRVGTAMAATVLKGAGGHRLMAGANLATACANVILSVMLIKGMGLKGVAIGTLVPVGIECLFVIYPAACRRVGVSTFQATSESIWPALWPAIPMALYLVATRPLVKPSLPLVAANLVAGGLVYAGVFFAFGLTVDERRLFLSRLSQGAARMRMLLPSTGGA